MRIGINLLYLIPGVVGGTENYAAGLVEGLSRLDKENEYFVFINQESVEWEIPKSSNFYRILCPVEAIKRSQRYFFEQFRLPKLLKRYEIDIIHSLGYVGPLFASCETVVTTAILNMNKTKTIDN